MPSSHDTCGILCCKPKFAAKLGDIRAFMFAICFASVLQTSFSGYSASQATSLEQRFQVSSLVLGGIMASFEGGYILAVIVLSFFTKRLHVPRLVGFCLLSLTTGALIWASSNFIFPSATNSSGVNSLEYCNISTTSHLQSSRVEENEASSRSSFIAFLIIGQMMIGIGSSPMMTVAPPYIDDHIPKFLAAPLIALVYTFAAVGIIFGYGVGAIMIKLPKVFPQLFNTNNSDDYNQAWWIGYLVLGTMDFLLAMLMFMFPRFLNKISESITSICPEIMPNFPPHKNPIEATTASDSTDKHYISAISKMSDIDSEKLDPNINHNITEGFNNNHADTYLHKKRDSTAESNCSTFTRVEEDAGEIKDEQNRTNSLKIQNRISTVRNSLNTSIRKYEVETIQSFFEMFKGLICNRTYILATFGMALEMFNMIGFGYFAPKFFETVFQISKLNASISVGIILVPAGAVGILVGGYLIKSFKWEPKASSLFILILSTICLCFIFALLAFTCPNIKISGVNSDPFEASQKPDLINSCNKDCDCQGTDYAPVCYREKLISYMSPCHAGCRVLEIDPTSKDRLHKDCLCLVHKQDLTNVTLHEGLCKNECNYKTAYLIIIAIGLFLCGMVQNPLVMITLRSVDVRSRTFALSYQLIVLRLFAYIPSTPFYGMLFDSTCLISKSQTETGSRFCNYVDGQALNKKLIWLFASVKIGASIIYLILYISLVIDGRREKKNLLSQLPTKTIKKIDPELKNHRVLEIPSDNIPNEKQNHEDVAPKNEEF